MSLPSLAWFGESRIIKITLLFGIIAAMFIFVDFIIIGLWNLAVGCVVLYFSYKMWKYKHPNSIKYQEYSKLERVKINNDYTQEISDEMRLNNQLILENQYEILNKFNDN